ncbi:MULTISPECIES: LysE family translocator [Pandoraea]|uniref:Amino acid transporter n=1 Tax=Pandoraea pnomenusa TaxID=93220 RepID=A0A378YKX9_9BURK|nr:MULTISPECIES: LysE family translocator [Pandoraea]AHB04532.1 amino acid transporter [Pandoraea pnomenusa 3kgm]AHB75084.1 amino acid transporter [Pandoraea pnomenusa]AIU26839.1 amino acid transporter [Pandoraea pnomenusa]MBN9096383.1 LysE family translocator [Pandoraea pnomenusa]QDH61268.1 LysE family translocator [Pandoraea pnomenusa]
MSLQTWWLYVVTVFFVSATPGPNMLLVMTHGARHGLRPSLGTMAGCMTALIAMMSISAAGLGAVLKAWPMLFDTLRYIGAAYLVYLGYKSWRSPVDTNEAAARLRAPLATESSFGKLFKAGFLVAGSNPKAILFAAAFLPQFIDPTAAKLPQFSILLGTFAVIEVSWYLVYATGGLRIAPYLREARVLKAFNRISGGVFMGFGALMAAVHR